MKLLRWQWLNWFPRLLAMPTPEPAQQAVRIVAMQRNIVLPARVMFTAAVFYYLFFSHWLEEPASAREVVLDALQRYFIFYIIFNAIAAGLLILRRFPAGLVQWVVFGMGLIDGLLLAGLTVETGGFASVLFWVFPGLIVLNALSIPLATPQMVLNLSLSVFYLGAGLVAISVGESENTMYRSDPIAHRLPATAFTSGDITNLESFAVRLKKPSVTDGVSQFLVTQLSAETSSLLSNYVGGTNYQLQKDLTADLNRILTSRSIYDQRRFNGVALSPETTMLLEQKLEGPDLIRLNRALLAEAYPRAIIKARRPKFMSDTPIEPAMQTEAGSEPFVLRLMILWLMTASCYGVQLLSFRDRLAEEESRKSAARNDELRAAGRLAAEIAHQLKNPLGIINNAAFSLQRGLKDSKSDLHLQIDIIREEVERSDRILTQLMGYAQLSEGRVEKLNPVEELDRALAEALPPGANYAIKIRRDYAANLPTLLMQRNHLNAALVNLILNAREALHGRGVLTLSARCPDEHSIEIAVADDGPGIPPDKRDKIFEPYFTSKKKGTGLGLAIVKHNVELYSGVVKVESELGKGAKFVLSFPSKVFIRTA